MTERRKEMMRSCRARVDVQRGSGVAKRARSQRPSTVRDLANAVASHTAARPPLHSIAPHAPSTPLPAAYAWRSPAAHASAPPHAPCGHSHLSPCNSLGRCSSPAGPSSSAASLAQAWDDAHSGGHSQSQSHPHSHSHAPVARLSGSARLSRSGLSPRRTLAALRTTLSPLRTTLDPAHRVAHDAPGTLASPAASPTSSRCSSARHQHPHHHAAHPSPADALDYRLLQAWYRSSSSGALAAAQAPQCGSQSAGLPCPHAGAIPGGVATAQQGGVHIEDAHPRAWQGLVQEVEDRTGRGQALGGAVLDTMAARTGAVPCAAALGCPAAAEEWYCAFRARHDASTARESTLSHSLSRAMSGHALSGLAGSPHPPNHPHLPLAAAPSAAGLAALSPGGLFGPSAFSALPRDFPSLQPLSAAASLNTMGSPRRVSAVQGSGAWDAAVLQGRAPCLSPRPDWGGTLQGMDSLSLTTDGAAIMADTPMEAPPGPGPC